MAGGDPMMCKTDESSEVTTRTSHVQSHHFETEDDPLLEGEGEYRRSGRHHSKRRRRMFHAPLWILVTVTLLLLAVVLTAYVHEKQRQQGISSLRPPPPPAEDYDYDSLEDGSQSTIVGVGPRYTATQFISFTINTFGGFANQGECEGRDVDSASGMCYLGNRQNLTDDVYHRYTLLTQVLDTLRADIREEFPRVDHRRNVLKIFMLPEFYFRGPNGAYSMEELLDTGILADMADQLYRYISVPEFADYLFVFGTVIAASRSQVNNAPPYRPWDAPTMADDEVLYYNFAPVFKGGADAYQHNHRYIVTKKSISKIDFLSNNTMLPNPLEHNVQQYDTIPDSFRYMLESRNTRLIENNIIDIDGIRIGLEVCLDHKKGLLWNHILQETNHETKNSNNNNHNNNNNNHNNYHDRYPPHLVDVQLITSAGMAIEFGPNPIVPGGVVYMTDGGATSAACWRHAMDRMEFNPERTCRVPTPKGIKHYPPITINNNNNDENTDDTHYSSFFTISACQDILDFPMLQGYYSLYADQGCTMTLSDFGIAVMDEFKHNLPSIEFYPTVDLPNHKRSN